MRIFFDQGTPAPLRHHLTGHDVETAFERAWSQFKNGALIAAMASSLSSRPSTPQRQARTSKSMSRYPVRADDEGWTARSRDLIRLLDEPGAVRVPAFVDYMALALKEQASAIKT